MEKRETSSNNGLRSNVLFGSATALLFAVFAFQLYFHAVQTSTTFDEPAHTVAGYRYWQCADFGINPEHPPMLKLLAAAPLLLIEGLIEPKGECGVRLTTKGEMFGLGGEFFTSNGVDPVLIPARLFSSLMSILLAVLIFLAAWELFGRIEALTSLGVLAFEPTLIAHGSLVTTDMALTAMAFGSAYALFRFCREPSLSRFLVAGAAFGLMLSAKHSAVLFIPILFAVAVTDLILFRGLEGTLLRSIVRRIAAFVGMCVIAYMTLWAFYGFHYYALPGASSESVSVEEYIRSNGRPEMVESLSAKGVIALNKLQILPESYVLGLADIIATGSRNTWIAGKAYSSGQWFYFPAAFAVKASIALLLLLPLGLCLPLFSPESRRTALFLLLPGVIFFAVALTSKMNIGVRHILPVWAFFILFAAAGAVFVARRILILRYLVALLLVFHVVTAARVAPNYIAFANDIFGGPDRSYQMFRDSNVDWGQNYKLIAEYLEKEQITDCWWASFGNPEVSRYTVPCRIIPDGFFMRSSSQLGEVVPSVIEGTVLISVNNFPPRGGGEYSALLDSEPVAQIGGTIFVYKGRFDVPLAAALSRSVRANWLVRQNRIDEAIDEATEAVKLAPNDARSYMPLGLALAAAGRNEEARAAFESTVRLASTDPVLFRNVEVRAKSEIQKLNEYNE